MTEKRFEYIRTKYRHYIQDVEKNGEYIKGKRGSYGDFDLDKLTDLLNELHEENKKLKRENDILIKQRISEERLKQEIADYHTRNGRLHQLNNCLIRRLDEFHINYSDILREFYD